MYINATTGNGPTKFVSQSFAMAVAINWAHRSADIRLSVACTDSLYLRPGSSVKACSKNSVLVGPGQNSVTFMSGSSSFNVSK